MMFERRFVKRFLVLSLALALLCCSGCALPETEATAEPVVSELPAVSEAPQPPEKELPAPPDVDINSWEFLYAGINEGVGRYHPEIRIWENQYMDSRCMDQTIAFMEAAREAGHTVWINTGYRNFEYRLFWYEDAIYKYGSSYEAAKHVFPAGCSEHATGLAFDITDETMLHANYNNQYDLDMAGTDVYNWMVEHCTEYGFILRYPEGHEEHYERACYNAGHFRYVGQEVAEYITENDLCFEEFLALYEE